MCGIHSKEILTEETEALLPWKSFFKAVGFILLSQSVLVLFGYAILSIKL